MLSATVVIIARSGRFGWDVLSELDIDIRAEDDVSTDNETSAAQLPSSENDTFRFEVCLFEGLNFWYTSIQ